MMSYPLVGVGDVCGLGEGAGGLSDALLHGTLDQTLDPLVGETLVNVKSVLFLEFRAHDHLFQKFKGFAHIVFER